MQNEESTSSAETLENLQYANQHQSNSVLDPSVIAEQSEAFDSTAMGGHGQEIKRSADAMSDGSDDISPTMADVDLPKKKKTKGRVKIEMKFITNKLRRYTTFSKRKTGIMKKAYELSTLTGTQVMLLVASETGHVYTFATRKLQPMITSEAGKALIQTCLNSPDPPVSAIPNPDQRMSATGYEETDLSYSVNENEEKEQRMFTAQQIENSQVLVTSGTSTNAAMTGMTAMPSSGHSFPITTYLPPSTLQQGIKGSPSPSSYSVQAMPGGGFTTIFTPSGTLAGTQVQLGQSSMSQGQQHHQQMQILGQQVQLQRAQSQSHSAASSGVSAATTHQTGTVQSVSLSQDGPLQQNHEQTVESTQGGNQQAIVVPIAQTNQDGTVSYANVGVPSQMMLTTSSGQIPIMYSVYTPQSGVVAVSNLSENSEQGGQQSQLNGDVDAGQQSLSSTAIQVQQEMQHIYVNQTVVTETSGTQTQDEINSIVNEHSSLGADSDSAIDKNGLPTAANQEV